jgi:hypothetical protein
MAGHVHRRCHPRRPKRLNEQMLEETATSRDRETPRDLLLLWPGQQGGGGVGEARAWAGGTAGWT